MGMNRPSQMASPANRGGWPAPNLPPEANRKPSGLWHAWVVLTGPGDDAPQRTLEQRSRLRRARLSSVVMFGMLVLAVGILPLGLKDPTHATLGADAVLVLAVLFAAVLNRFGQVTFAALVLVAVLLFAIAGAVLGAVNLDFIYLPAFDLLALVIAVAAAVLPRRLMWLAALAAIAFIVVDMFLQPRTPELDAFVATNGVYALMARPILLVLVTAILLHLLSWSLENEVRRADRAEEIAAMEHTIVEQKRQLDIGVQQILDTHVRVANGDFSARAPTTQDNVLWQIAASLNNLLSRLQKSGQAEHQLRRTEEEIYRLASAIRDAQSGRRPIWPAPTGTAADRILELLARPAMREPQGPPPALPPQRPGSFPSEPASGYFPNAGPPPPQMPQYPPQMPQYPPQMPQQQWPDLRPPSASPSPSPFSNPWALPADQES